MIPAPPGYEGRPPREWPVPEMDHAAGGVESAYTPEMGRVILGRIAAGETVKAITADPRLPSYATVYRWVRMHEGFGADWMDLRARLARQAIAEDVQARADRAAFRTFKEGLGLARRRRGGRRSSYTAAVAGKICRRIAAGAALTHVLAEPDMPSAKAVYGWLRTRPAFRKAYVAACDKRAEALELRIFIAEETAIGRLERQPRAEIDALAGRIGRLVPKKYRALP